MVSKFSGKKHQSTCPGNLESSSASISVESIHDFLMRHKNINKLFHIPTD